MTITFHGIKPESRTATNSKGIRTYRRTYILTSTDIAEGEYSVGSHPSLPIIGEAHDEDAAAYCQELTITQTNGYVGWEATATWSTEYVLATDPTNDDAIIEWQTEQFQRPCVFDRDGDAVVNSAGDPFDPPVMMDDSRRVIVITKNLSVVPSYILTYQDAVNISSFSVDGITVGAGLAKVQQVNVGGRQNRNGTDFRTVTIIIHVEKGGWDLSPLDAGFRVLGPSNTRQNILNDGDNERPTAPVPLDGAGGLLFNPGPTNGVYIPVFPYELKDFSALPLV